MFLTEVHKGFHKESQIFLIFESKINLQLCLPTNSIKTCIKGLTP
jgi:hypothetical protein